MSGYNCWTIHGERGVMMEDNDEEENDDNYPMYLEYSDTAMEENEEEEAEERVSDVPADDLGQVIHYWKKVYSRDVTGNEKTKIVTDNWYT
jgi:hypothetical protein